MERKTPPPGYTCHRCNVPGMLDLENCLFLLNLVLIWSLLPTKNCVPSIFF